MASRITPKAVPTGGVVTLTIASAGTMTLSRAVSGAAGLGTFTQLYSGGPQPFFIDVGDQLPGPLDPGTFYVYRLEDDNGVLDSVPIEPTPILVVQTEPITLMLQRTIQGAINTLALPPGVQRMQVLQAMPVAGIPAMPFITLNLNLLQQENTPIGQSAWIPDDNGTTIITGTVHRMYMISILSMNGPERDFYRDSMVGILQSFIGAILAPIGRDLQHKFQISSGQIAKDNTGMGPGFYYADCMLEFTGTLNTVLLTNYGLIEQIDFSAYTDGRDILLATVPIPQS